jgi:para-aminobenzoate synthetase / 4-amino-4-deoxychorismate lyase
VSEGSVICRPLDWELSAVDVLRMVRADSHPVALLGAWAGGSDIVSSSPVRVSGPPEPPAEVLAAPLPDLAGAGFGGGWIGYLGFGAGGQWLPVPPAPGPARQLPDWWFGYYDHVLRRDRDSGQWAFEALWTPDRSDELERRFRLLMRRARAADSRPRGYKCGDFRLLPSAPEHRSAVRQAVSAIRRGDIFQANICLRLEAPYAGDPLDAFCQAAKLSPAYAAFLRIPGGAVASLSPELFLRRNSGTVFSKPIKGTRSRAAGEGPARVEREALERSAKDRAENVMIVDLMRNDLSRVCLPGSVHVPALLRAEPHPGLWHLVSDVRGTLRPGVGDEQLIAATFPPGSVTGAPKVRAVEIIHELEVTPREVYTGAIGYRSPVAGLELNVAIRTFEFCDDRVWLGSGGGITARSSGTGEYRECLVKAAPLIRALGATLREEPALASSAAVAPGLRPRAARGVFTSLRVTDGAVRDLDAHLARLDASTWRLFGKHLPPGLAGELTACLAKQPSGRLRVTARPVGGPLQVTVEVVPAGAPAAAVTLHPVTIPGGIGGDKWADRRLLAALAESGGLGPDDQLLIEDRNGDVLETDRASLFALIDGALHTPPADGRQLPGITRAAVLRLAASSGITTRETPLSRQALLAASEVFLTNSMHGIVPVRSLAGTGVSWNEGPVTDSLRRGLTGWTAEASSGTARPIGPSRTGLIRRLHAGQGQPAIVLIDNYDSFTYNLAHLLLSNGSRVEVVRNDEITARGLASLGPAGIVISPGPGSPADAGVSLEAVRLCAATTPLLGICLGHQSIAAAYGATIATARHPVHGQASLISHDGNGVLAGLPPRFRAGRYHSLIVAETSLPSDLVITARGPGGIPMGLRHVRHPAEGVQFHPESILTPHGEKIICNFLRIVRAWARPAEHPGRRPGRYG